MLDLLLFLLPILASAAVTPAISKFTCRAHITVSGAGTDAINGKYYDDTDSLSDSVQSYYKWSEELNDWILLFRDTDTTTYWLFMTLGQLNAADYRDYYNVQSTAAFPPTTGYSGSDADAVYSLGALPNPTIEKTASGWVWDENTAECVRECTAAIPQPTFECGVLNVKGAIAAPKVNGDYAFSTGEMSDCVPSWIMVQGDGTTDSNGNTTYSNENVFLVYRYMYYDTTWWIMQDAKQLGATEFVEHYSVVADALTAEPPTTGWRKTESLVVNPSDPSVKPIALTITKTCTVEEKEQQEKVKDGVDLPDQPTTPDVPTEQPPPTGDKGGGETLKAKEDKSRGVGRSSSVVCIAAWCACTAVLFLR